MKIREGTKYIAKASKQAIIEFVFTAYMFGKIIEKLLEANQIIFKIISTADFSGRRV